MFVSRQLAFVAKELTEVIRRPAAVLGLIVGPLALMLLFGFGYSGTADPLATVVVAPDGSGLPDTVEGYQDFQSDGIEVVGVTTDIEQARDGLHDGRYELAIIAPTNVEQRWRQGEQSIIRLEYNQVDPQRAGFADFAGRLLSLRVNQEIVRRFGEAGEEYLVREGVRETPIDPDLLAEPTRIESENLAVTQAQVIPFYAPALLALVLQHTAMTLIGLSLVRERTSGAIEIFRIAPITTFELVTGKVLAYGLIIALVAAASVALLVLVIGVPILSGLLPVAVVVLLLAAVSSSDRQAVQLGLLVLIASIFFGGMLLPLDSFTTPVQVLAFALPVTHATRLLQEFMLTGIATDRWGLSMLALLTVGSLALSVALVRRAMSPV